MTPSLRDHFTTLIKRCKSKTRREVKRFEESERRTEADAQQNQTNGEN